MKYDKEHIERLVNSLSDGDGRVRACKIAGIAFQTFCRWMEDSEFCEQIKKAERDGYEKIKDLCIRKIVEDKSWQSKAWWLERKYRDEFAQRQEQDVNLNQPIQITIKEVSKSKADD